MKKLLALVLVLAVTSVVSAVIVSPMQIVKQGETYAINMPSGMAVELDGPSGGYWALIGVDPASGQIVAPGFFDGAAILGGGADIGMADGVVGGFTVTGTWTAAAPQGAGIYAQGFVALPGVQVLELWQLDDGYAPIQMVDSFVIPEPATMAILALGGLLFRRK